MRDHSLRVQGNALLSEALLLQVAGLVSDRSKPNVFTRGRAASAKPFSKAQMIDAIEARQCIEMQTAALAATRRNTEQLDAMEQVLISAKALADDREAVAVHHVMFHREVAEASGNIVLQQAFDFLVELHSHQQRALLIACGDDHRDHLEHFAILEALSAGDAAAAEQEMRVHLERVLANVRAWDPESQPV